MGDWSSDVCSSDLVLDKYILREFLTPFSVLILAFVMLFLIGDIFNDLEDFLSKKAPMNIIVSYFLLKLPYNISFVLPISVLLACMYTMANFGRNMEITAMRSSGISLMRCGGTIFVVGFLVSMVNFYFNEKLVPESEREADIIMKRVTKGEERVRRMYSMLTYRSPDKRRTWLFTFFNNDGEHEDVTLKFYREDGTLGEDISADKAVFTSGGWLFKNAHITEYSKDGLLPKSPKDMNEYLVPNSRIPETPKDIANAVKLPEELPSWVIWGILSKTQNMAEKCRDVYSTTLYYRLAFPWACFLAVFLGIPLATKNERSGIFLAIVTAIGVIVTYQVTTHIFLILGKQGFIHPLIAGFAPTLGFIAYGWFNVSRRL